MLRNKVNKAFSILERINQEKEEEEEKNQNLEQDKLKQDKLEQQQQDQLYSNRLNHDEQLKNIITNPQFYLKLVSFLLFIKQQYPNELTSLKYFLMNHEPFEERIVIAYLFLCFGIHIYIVSQSITPIKDKSN
tara:strand:+ start:10728 stop:11126 length:399 start_codon:yes stop_codon:yes gene_type:complete